MMLKALVKEDMREARLINFEANEEVYRAIKENADKYAGGNISAWLRFAGQHYKPKQKDLTED